VGSSLLATGWVVIDKWSNGAHPPGAHAHRVNERKNHQVEEEWKTRLPEQYRVLRQKARSARSPAMLEHEGQGAYRCAGCGEMLFQSDTMRFRLWVAGFYAPASTNVIAEAEDAVISWCARRCSARSTAAIWVMCLTMVRNHGTALLHQLR
jgi:hypothetical protein